MMLLFANVPPLLLLATVVAITAIALLTHRMVRHAHRNRLRRLAAEWNMHYAPKDLFSLSTKVAESFPIPQAHDVLVLDLIYGLEGNGHRYLFTAEYAEGPGLDEPRHRRAMSLCEPRDSQSPSLAAAPENLPLIEQYQKLHEACA